MDINTIIVILSLSSVSYVVYRTHGENTPLFLLMATLSLFMILSSVKRLLNNNNNKVQEKFVAIDASGATCEHRKDGKTVTKGCYYNSCHAPMPKDGKCPGTIEEYRNKIAKEKNLEGGEVEAVMGDAQPVSDEEKTVEEEQTAEEEKTLQEEEKKKPVEKLPECSANFINELLFLLPRFSDIEIKSIEEGRTKEIPINNGPYNVEKLRPCFNQSNYIKLQNKIHNYIVENPNDLNTNCVILRGAQSVSKNIFTKNFLGEILSKISCIYDCKLEGGIDSFESDFLKNSAGPYEKERTEYMKTYKKGYVETCPNQTQEQEQEQKQEQEQEQKQEQAPQKLSQRDKELQLPGNYAPNSGYVVIPKKGPPIFDFYNSSHTNISNLNFKSRDEMIETCKKYVCNRSPAEIQAYKYLGKNVDGLDWWNEASKSTLSTPDNRLLQTRENI